MTPPDPTSPALPGQKWAVCSECFGTGCNGYRFVQPIYQQGVGLIQRQDAWQYTCPTCRGAGRVLTEGRDG